jgi:predicted DNA-binding transcriptional regulator AlpA
MAATERLPDYTDRVMDVEKPVWVDALLAELRAQRDVMEYHGLGERLWSTAEIGQYFGVEAKTACGIVSAHTFPDPVDAPGVGRRWIPDEVRAWARRHRRPKRSPRKVSRT